MWILKNLIELRIQKQMPCQGHFLFLASCADLVPFRELAVEVLSVIAVIAYSGDLPSLPELSPQAPLADSPGGFHDLPTNQCLQSESCCIREKTSSNGNIKYRFLSPSLIKRRAKRKYLNFPVSPKFECCISSPGFELAFGRGHFSSIFNI